MTKAILLFIQSKNPDTYVNALTHCVLNEGVQEVFFAVSKEITGKSFEAAEIIDRIRARTNKLSTENVVYQPVQDKIPQPTQLKDRVFKVVFVRPQDAIPDIKKKFADLDNLLVDVTGCNKHLAGDVMSSYMAHGIRNICHFELADRVFLPDWKADGKTLLYHDLKGNISYYEYQNFSEPGPTIESFNRLRAQGRAMKALLILSVILGFVVILLIQQEQTAFAQIAALVIAIATGLGFMEDSLSLFDRFK